MASNETATFNVFSYDGTPSFYYNSKMTSRRLQQARDLAAEIMKDRIREADKLQSNYTAMMETLEREERAMQNDVQEQEKKVQILTIMMVIDKDTMRNMEALENETMERLDVEIWERRARWIEMEEYAEIVDEVRELERLTAEIEERRTRMEEMKEKHASKLEYLQQMQQELHQAREHAAAKMNERIREAQNHPYISYLRYASSCQSSADIAHCGLTTYGNNSNTVEREEKRGRKRRQYVEERINRRTKRIVLGLTGVGAVVLYFGRRSNLNSLISFFSDEDPFYMTAFMSTSIRRGLEQDGIAASGITEHVLLQLKENGVEKVYIRSDNAGTYHNAGYLSTLFHIHKKTGVQVLAYIFSEAQAGKGDADREISHSKRKIRDGVDSKKNATNAHEVIEVLTTGTLLKASSFHEVELTEISISKSSFPGVASYGSFRFEENGIRARKFDKIGGGILIEEKKIISNEVKCTVLSEGGYLSKSDGFWKKFDDDEDKDIAPEEELDENATAPVKEGIFSCPDRLCISQFLTVNGLAKHKLRGVHRRRKNTESTIDAGVRMFSKAVETDTAAARSVKSDSLIEIKKSIKAKLPEKGWAMKRLERATKISNEMETEITEYFHKQRGEGRRALAREICASLKELKNAKTGEYLFPLDKCPKESQCQTAISSLLRQERSAGSQNLKQTTKRRKLTNDEETSEESSDENQPSGSTNNNDANQMASKKKRNTRMKNATIPIFEDEADEYADFMEEIDDADDDFFD